MNQGQPTQPVRAVVVRLHPDTVERLATRVAVRVAQQLEHSPSVDQQRPGLLTAAEVSEWWGVHRSWVYQHAHELGAIHIGTGERPRLRFDPEQVALRLAQPRSRPTETSQKLSRQKQYPRESETKRSLHSHRDGARTCLATNKVRKHSTQIAKR